MSDYKHSEEDKQIMMRYCPKCGEIDSDVGFSDEEDLCYACGTKAIHTNFSEYEYENLSDEGRKQWRQKLTDVIISKNPLYDKEYIIIQEAQQLEQQRLLYKKYPDAFNPDKDACVPKCPTCNSTMVEQISGVERGASVFMFGLFSKKINKSFKCKNCGYTW